MAQLSLNQPYGGSLVQRIIARDHDSIHELTQNQLTINDVAESDLINIATGAFSPLTGFLGSKDFESVCKNSCLTTSKLPWTIPILLGISEKEKAELNFSKKIHLFSGSRKIILGWIEPVEVFPHNKSMHIEHVFGTSDKSHPGVDYVSQMPAYLLAGEVFVFADVLENDPLAYPRGVRDQLEEMKLFSVAGFQTRNVVHRAHEYLQRVAMETVGGILIHPVIGWKKVGDFKPEVVRASYKYFSEAFYPANKSILAFLNLAMRYAGPREAVFHAIIRKNHGCSHFIVGRDHAGVGNYYSTYAAHQIFDLLPAIGIDILKLFGPFYCYQCAGIATDRTCGHSEYKREHISGSQIRKILLDGNDPGEHIFRPDVLKVIRGFANEDLFYE